MTVNCKGIVLGIALSAMAAPVLASSIVTLPSSNGSSSPSIVTLGSQGPCGSRPCQKKRAVQPAQQAQPTDQQKQVRQAQPRTLNTQGLVIRGGVRSDDPNSLVGRVKSNKQAAPTPEQLAEEAEKRRKITARRRRNDR